MLSYFEVAVLFRSTFGPRTMHNIESLNYRKKCLNRVNGFVYFAFIIFFFIEMFIKGSILMSFVFAFYSTIILSFLYFAM